MEIVETFRSAIGSPQVLREVKDGNHVVAMVGRWRHSGTRVEYGVDPTAMLVFNVSGGHCVERHGREPRTMQAVQAGSIGTVMPGDLTHVTVAGQADIVTIFMSQELLQAHAGSAGGSKGWHAPGFEHDLQAAAVRALVALMRDDDESCVELRRVVRVVADVFAAPGFSSPETRAGLASASLRRAHALIERRLDGDVLAPPRVGELADAAGLSPYHFIREFRRSEGQTPHARVLARRLERALTQLLKGDDGVGDVAERLGFSSPSYFVSSFRKQFGVTPGSIRKAADVA